VTRAARPLALVALAGALALGACGGDGGSPAKAAGAGGRAAAADTVAIADFAFAPTPLQVTAGTTVTIANQDGVAHTATSTGDVPAAFDTGDLDKGATATVTLDQPGSYTYHCDIHNYMKGEIVVR
jgi:plastocyanin